MKMKALTLGLILCILSVNGVTAHNAFMKMFPRHPTLYPRHSVGDAGDPVFLTKYLDEANPGLARTLAQVNLQDKNKTTLSYSGYITVNKITGSNMFFWFFVNKQNYKTAPVVLWLQGGPGGSSLYGLFEEHGPWSVDEKLNINIRNTSWANMVSMLYVDNPVGTGFSFTKDKRGYARNQDDVSRDLFEFLQQFFYMFAELKDNEFYVTGESYAGKYVPALAYKIHLENSKKGTNYYKFTNAIPEREIPTTKLNLAGMAIGDGLCDLYYMCDYSNVLEGAGMIDQNEFEIMAGLEGKAKSSINAQKWQEAVELWDPILNCDRCKTTSYFTNVTGSHNYFNYLRNDLPIDESYYPKFLNQDTVRAAIHVGKLPFHDGSEVERYLWEDIPKSVRLQVAGLLNATKPKNTTKPEQYKVLFYTGQLDVIVSHQFTENFLLNLKEWKGNEKFVKSQKEIVWLNGESVGYTTSFSNLRYVMVRNAGHMIPRDQPEVAYDMMNRFIFNKPF